jgi:putative CRISPR-associated protein (TIGR02619 family)
MRTILTTVGTSLLTNAARHLGIEKPDRQDLANYLRRTSPEKASAEANSLSRLLKQDDQIVFLHSQTEQSKLCAEALRGEYERKGFISQLREVPDLTYKESRFKMRGLRSLVATMIKLIREEKRDGREVLVNATGGFKAEIAYATLVGLLFHVPVYYIHELFEDIIEMPPMPINWDYSLLADYEEFFEWVVEEDRPTSVVDKHLRGLPRDVQMLLTEVDNVTILSPTGEALYEAYINRLDESEAVRVMLSPAAQQHYSEAPPNVQKLFDRALRKLRVPELRRSGSERLHNCDCFVYPRGRRDERVFYFEEDDSVYVCELARHSDRSYERLLKQGVRRENYQGFQRWSPS